MLSRLRRPAGLPRAARACAAPAGVAAKPTLPARAWGATRWFVSRKVAVPLPFLLWGGSTTLQHYFGSSDNFFEGRFTTKKDPDDLAEFYQAEDLLKIIAVIPLFFNLFMNKVDPDTEMPTEDSMLLSVEETHFRVRLFGMEVSFEIIQHEEEIDGETKPTSFMRHERFIDWVPILADFGYKQLLWDQTWMFGFDRKEDGSIEVYHRGEKFEGPWPIRMIVQIHQYYVLWACEKYINGDAFGTEDLDRQQEQLACMPLDIFKKLVRRIRTEKEKSLRVLKDDPKSDRETVAKAMEQVAKLAELEARDQSSISVVKRSGATGSLAAKSSMKMVAGDAATSEVLKTVFQDEKGAKDAAVVAAAKEVVHESNLEFKERPRPAKKAVAGT